jgi:PAS domain-containing protein
VDYDLAVLILEEKPQQMYLFLQVVHPIASQLVEEAKINLINAYNSISMKKVLYSKNFDKVVGGENIEPEKDGVTPSSPTLNTFLNVPLMDGEKMIGMVHISSQLDRPYSSEDIGLIYSMMNQVQSTVHKLNDIKMAEKNRLEKLTERISDGVIMLDENFEVVTVNPAAQKILGKEKPDLQYIQNCLGLDLQILKIRMETAQEDMIIKEVKILARTYHAAVSLIKGKTECFEGVVLSINPMIEERPG